MGGAHTPGCDGNISKRRPPAIASDSDYEAVLMVKARRDRLDAAITVMAADSESTPVVHRLGASAGSAP